jgi:hypothetical protein
MGLTTVTVDFENNVEKWWDALRADPELASLPIADTSTEWCEVTDGQLAALKALPGWSDGPKHAPNPLIVRERNGQRGICEECGQAVHLPTHAHE